MTRSPQDRPPLEIDRRAFVGGSAIVGLAAATPLRAEAPSRRPLRDQPFDQGWAFHLGDVPGAERPDFDDRPWRRLDLPHDWSIEDRMGSPREASDWTAPSATWSETARGELKPDEYMKMPVVPQAGTTSIPLAVGPFDPAKSAGGPMTGWTVGGTGWYRKTFDASIVGGLQTELRFDGAFQVTEVWINGAFVARNVNGYTSFVADLTPHLVEGRNLVAVRVLNEGSTSRWYSGSGLYRHVWLTTTRAVRLPWDGVAIAIPVADQQSATVLIEVEVENRQREAIATDLAINIISPAGLRVASRRLPIAALPGTTVGKISLEIANPTLWAVGDGRLHRAEIKLFVAGQLVDERDVRFGIRTIAIDAVAGLRVNGVAAKLRGACVHHDNGLLGARSFDGAEYRKAQLLKANGFNAVRCAHNPPAPAFLDACDELGLLVIDEAFDVWEAHKTPADYASFFPGHWRADLTAMIRRDRNHPSIFLWGLGNEIRDNPGPGKDALGRALREEALRLDPTRGVITALNEVFAPIDGAAMREVDVVGLNYRVSHYETDHAFAAVKPIIGTETYSNDMVDAWRKVEAYPWLLGDFTWTGIDYLGETGLGSNQLRRRGEKRPAQKLPFTTFYWDYPAFTSGCGDLDLIGDKKPKSFFRDVLWGRSAVELQVERPLPMDVVEELDDWGWHDELPSWTWDVADGTPLTVRAYTSAEEVRLMLNGREVGRRSMGVADRLTASFTIPYRRGRIEAVAVRNGREIGRSALESAGPAHAIRITPDRSLSSARRRDVVYLAIDIVDAVGRLVPDAAVPLTLSLSSSGRLLAGGSANPRGVESLTDNRCHSFHGRALAIVQPRGQAATLEVTSPNLRRGRALVRTN